MKKELKEIMSLSFPFCKNPDKQIALFFQKINSLAHETEVYIERNGLNKKNHWTNQHNKNYHGS
ncbi:hypothetical protein CMI37_24275 [Candidatus Pacearchaeota archaeon]|jgi:hypothetical protein|nr:hypothetical protein [Candidatus Pacearchaeota archaeon]|tara:strand:- start:1081 stop:1272 length:192 start_codon:yes stop_codon:yes gene_type:complete